MLKRAREGEAMSIGQYREALAGRTAARAAYGKLASIGAGCISLSAAGCAPVGLRSTGNAAFVVTGSMLGIPTISIPVLAEQDLPLGLQVLGFENRDADVFSVAGALMNMLPATVRA